MSQDQAQNLQEPLSSSVLPTAGAVLAAQRQQLGLSLLDVSAKLKLSKRQIEALESDRYGELPGNTFVRGFVRNYARLLELDPQPLIAYLDAHLPREAAQSALPRLRDEPLPVLRPSGSAGRSPFVIAILGAMALVLVGAGGYWLYEKSRRFEPELTLAPANSAVVLPAGGAAGDAPAQVAPQAAALPPGDQPVPAAVTAAVPVQTPPPNLPGNPPPAVASPVAVPAPVAPSTATAPVVVAPAAVPPTPASADIRVVAQRDSWVQIVDANGRRLVNELLPAGQSRSVAGTPPYRIRIGNGRHTELFYKGKPTDLAPYTKVDVANLELN
ncbi:helix-turn-helix domain-containing protein [Chitinimonas arctica]|nr:RodZ domain-containing protein [Chitinimonas arctica]